MFSGANNHQSKRSTPAAMRRCPALPTAVAAAAVAEPLCAVEPQCAGRRKWTRAPVNLMTHDGVLLVSATPRMLRAAGEVSSPERSPQGGTADEVPKPPSSASPTEQCKCEPLSMGDSDGADGVSCDGGCDGGDDSPQQTPVEPFGNNASLDLEDAVVAHGGSGVADVDDLSVVEI